MHVIKRNGRREPVSFDKVIRRLKSLCGGLETVDPILVAQKVCSQIYNDVPTYQLDELAAEICTSMSTINPEFGILSSRIIVSNNHKNTSPSFSETADILYNNKDNNGNHCPLLADDVYEVICKNKSKLNNVIDYTRDYNFDYFAFKTLEKAYLFKVNDKVVERIQHMYMRVSIGLHKDDIKRAIESYNFMSRKYFTHATPTLYHSGTPKPQLLSCFLLGSNDSIGGIYKTISDCAAISKWAGGIGLHISNIRSKGSRIRGTNGKSDGIIPMLKVYNETAKYVNQCFTPDTVIYTKDGVKDAKNIKIGDELLTKDGSFRSVMKVFKNDRDEEIIKYRVMSSLFPNRCTIQHQIFVLKNIAQINNIGEYKRRLSEGIIQGEYVNAGDLTDKDFVVYPIPTYIADVEENDLFYFYLYGICLMKSKVNEGIVSLEIDEHLIGDVKKFLNSRDIVYEIEKRKIFKWKIDDDIFHHNLKMHDNKKRLYEEYWNLPNEKMHKIMKGIFYKRDLEIRIRDYEKSFVSTLRYMGLRLGFLLRGELKNGLYHIRYPKELDGKKNNRYFRYEDKLYTKIMKVKMVKYKGPVYDFNVDENHNYTTDSGLVHNSGKRPGSFAMYIEPTHPDIMPFLDLKKNHGNEDERARDLFLAMWIPDLFMEKVRDNEDWCLFDPDECPRLPDVYGEEYHELYMKYYNEGRAKKIVKARDIWNKILESQIETGVPYIGFKDHVNRKNNQKNYGVIKSSNLCVAPETKILTSDGYRMIGELENQSVHIWNGQEFSGVIVRCTSENTRLIEIHLENGNHIVCTEYHKFYIYLDNHKNVVEVKANELQLSDRLIDVVVKFNNGLKEFIPKDAIILGNDMYKYSGSKVAKIIDNGRYDKTYCFNEPLKHMGVFNGILAGNCIEINEYSDDKEYACCFTADTKILTKDGYRPIVECDGKEVMVPYFTDQILQTSIHYEKVILHHNGIKDVYKILLENGKIIKATRDHLFLNRDKQWRRLDELSNFDGLIMIENGCEMICNVRSIDYYGCASVYDLTTLGMGHHFIVECGIVAHNCTLASLALPMFVNNGFKYDYDKLIEVVSIAVRNLNKVVDLNFYPVPETEYSNKKHRPLGLGVQGLADVFFKMRMPFESDMARELNRNIFETIYYAAVKTSCQLAQEKGPYETFRGSPMSQGQFQFDLWGIEPSDRYDWDTLRKDVMKYGVRNSLLIALMPTASTSQILGNNEAFEALTSNLYSRRTIAGDFVLVNKYLVEDLIKLGVWNIDMKNMIISANGSIQNIEGIPQELKDLYKTVWEIKQKAVIQMAIDRGPFICQTQSMNLFFEEPTPNMLHSALMFAWRGGLKTGSYYIRTRPKVQAQQFTIAPDMKKKEAQVLMCSLKNREACESCSG